LTNLLLTPSLANSGRYNFSQVVFPLSPKKERYLIILRIENTLLHPPPKKKQNPANEIEVTISPMLALKPSFNNYLESRDLFTT
jgi:hypothetical protein